MPSPIAHSMLGLATASAYFLHRSDGFNVRQNLRKLGELRWLLFWCILLANAPDMDFVFRFFDDFLRYYHRQTTHTLLWVGLMSILAWLGLRRALFEGGLLLWLGFRGLNRSALKPLLLTFALMAGHLALDYFSFTIPPDLPPEVLDKAGLPLLYPFYDHGYCSTITVFPPMSKAGLAGILSGHNLRVVLIELAWTVPVFLAVLCWKSTRSAEANIVPKKGDPT